MMSAEEVAKYLSELDTSFCNESVLFAKSFLRNNDEETVAVYRRLIIIDAKIFALKMVLK